MPPMSFNESGKASSSTDNWIYHERQVAALCGQHALNNLVQSLIFSPEALADIAHAMDAAELAVMREGSKIGARSKEYNDRLNEGSGNVDAQGNFSIQVLKTALSQKYNLTLQYMNKEESRNVDPTTCEGFIMNKQSHWFAIRKINGRYWNLNSTKERPMKISHFHLAAEIGTLQAEGYTVFTVDDGDLPPPCSSSKERVRGKAEYWWKEEDLINDVTNATTGSTDPWAGVGDGMRLDGGSTGGGGSGRREEKRNDNGNGMSGYGGGGGADGEDADLQRALLASTSGSGSGSASGSRSTRGLTEDEMIRMAIEASMSSSTSSTSSTSSSKTDVINIDSDGTSSSDAVPDEPSETAPNVIKLQIRLPNNKRAIRRFLTTDSVSSIYAYVNSVDGSCGGGKSLELRAFFPPKSIASMKGGEIGDAGLDGESLAGRWM